MSGSRISFRLIPEIITVLVSEIDLDVFGISGALTVTLAYAAVLMMSIGINP